LKIIPLLIPLLLMTSVHVQGKDSTIEPPRAPIEDFQTRHHGELYTDEYHWLANRRDPRVVAYLKAENAYTEAVMAPTRELQEKIYQEIKNSIQETDLSVPVKLDDWYYYTRTQAGLQYPIYCRRHGSPEAPEEIYLDQNTLAAKYDFLELGDWKSAPTTICWLILRIPRVRNSTPCNSRTWKREYCCPSAFPAWKNWNGRPTIAPFSTL